MSNTQKGEGIDFHTDTLDVCEVWDTIQGEGPLSGNPATFIRLAGCNLECNWCDTDYTSNRRRVAICDIISWIGEMPKRALVVLTGGEPLRQNVAPLVKALRKYPYPFIQIETNGTRPLSDFLLSEIKEGTLLLVCSPKTPKVHQSIWDNCFALKYVVRAGEIDEDGLPLTSVGTQYGMPAKPPKDWKGTIYIQPLDEYGNEYDNEINREAALESCRDHGHTLSLQIHKLVGVE